VSSVTDLLAGKRGRAWVREKEKTDSTGGRLEKQDQTLGPFLYILSIYVLRIEGGGGTTHIQSYKTDWKTNVEVLK